MKIGISLIRTSDEFVCALLGLLFEINIMGCRDMIFVGQLHYILKWSSCDQKLSEFLF